MWLPHCIETRMPLFRVVWLLAVSAVLAACAAQTPDRPRVASAEASAVDAQGSRVIPPEAQTLFEQAVAVMAAGDGLEAQFRFEEFILRYPDFPGAYTNLAIIHAQGGDDQAAEERITDALLIDPRHTPTLNQLGMLLRRQGKFADAEAAYLRALEASPSYAIAHYNLGVLYELYLQQLDSALLHFEQYQSLNGEDEQVGKWITDLKRRVGADRRTANVTE